MFEDGSDNAWNRERALERLSQVTLPTGVSPQMGTDWSPVGQIYFFTLHNTNPQIDVMDLKSIEDWVVEKNLKSVPDIVDVATFGGPTREYQVRLDPYKLISYGLSIAQVAVSYTHLDVYKRQALRSHLLCAGMGHRQLCRGETGSERLSQLPH